MIEVKDIMQKCPVVLRPETTLADAARLLSESHCSGVPVVTADREVVGMISEDQLLDVVFDLPARDEPVSNFMTPELVVLMPTDPVSRVAQLFALYRFRRLPVVENGKFVGMVTRGDLINYALQSSQLFTEPLVDLVPELAPMS